jgi:hypothetical protein
MGDNGARLFPMLTKAIPAPLAVLAVAGIIIR